MLSSDQCIVSQAWKATCGPEQTSKKSNLIGMQMETALLSVAVWEELG